MFHFLNSDSEITGQTDGLQQAAFYLLLGFLFLLPIVIIPSTVLSFQFAKVAFVALAVIVALTLYILSILKTGWISYPTSWSLLIVSAVPLAYLLASVFSPVPIRSLFGYGQEITSFSFILLVFLLTALVAQLFISRDRIFYSYMAFFAAFFVLAVFHLLRLILGPDFLSFGLFETLTANTIGQWSDLAIFFGLGGILALVTLEEVRLSRWLRGLMIAALVVAIIFLAIVNLVIVWYVLAALALFYFVLTLSAARQSAFAGAGTQSVGEASAFEPEHHHEDDHYHHHEGEHHHEGDHHREGEHHHENEFHLQGEPSASVAGSEMSNRISISSLVVLLVAVAFIMGGQMISNFITDQLEIASLDVRPSWGATIEVAQDTLTERPIFGVGPNSFANQWLKSKPETIDQTIFWNTEFNHGVGTIPTALITTGVVGLLAWLAWLALILILGTKVIFRNFSDPMIRYLATSSFLAALFLWVMNIVYVPGVVVFTLTFIFTGLFGAALYLGGVIPTRRGFIFRDSKSGFINALALALMLILIVVFAYTIGQRTLASVYFQQANQSLRANELDRANQQLAQAVTLNPGDIYYRALAQLNIMRATRVVQERQAERLTEEEERRFSQHLQQAVAAAQLAIQDDQTNYRNWLTRGQIYQQAVLFGIEDAYDRARADYEAARERNPRSPTLVLQMARLEIAQNDLNQAREYISQAREMRANYPEAIFLLARLEASQGNIDEAISNTRQALQLAPRDAGLYFELGLLYYNDGQYDQAVSTLEGALEIIPRYANAKYFLGLAQARQGRTTEAISLFEELLESAPESEEVGQILSNLRAGRDPLAGLDVPDVGDELTSDEDLLLEDELEEVGELEGEDLEEEGLEMPETEDLLEEEEE